VSLAGRYDLMAGFGVAFVVLSMGMTRNIFTVQLMRCVSYERLFTIAGCLIHDTCL